MPSAILLRKNLLSILQDKIIPDIHRNGTSRLAVMELPLEVPDSIALREMPHSPLEITQGKRIYPEGVMWEDVQMHAMRFPSLYCVVEGEADLLMGVTTTMLREVAPGKIPPVQCGGYIVSCPAPAYLLFPPNVPQKRGQSPWMRPEPHRGILRIFHVRVLPVGALCNINIMKDSDYQVQYSLLINDSQLLPITEILLDELADPATNPQIAGAQLLSLMLRLQRGMSNKVPPMTDGLYSRFPEDNPVHLHPHSLEHPVIQIIHEYIKLHLHESLTPGILARQVRLSPAQLNRILRKNTGMSIMEYVLHHRMEVAQLLLRNSSQSVREIALLAGYPQLPLFSRTFHRYTGTAPLLFRQQQKSIPGPAKAPSGSEKLGNPPGVKTL